ncbi:MAG TPA: SIMPL domain-containing protein [Thermoanaerobaculia bacterium]|nr:SIMPL domain-containing protein [Thermoanaerobaculia bacterium]
MTRANRFLALGFALALLYAAPMQAQDIDRTIHPPPQPASDRSLVPNLVVQGTGQAEADPDQAVVRLGVVAQDASARTAQERANQVINALVTAVRGLGVDAKQVQTSALNLNPIYAQGRPDGSGQQEPRITGYQAYSTVSVRLDKLDLVGQVVDAGLAAGANQVEGVTFGLKDDQKARAEALEAAVRQARAKAQVIAAALGVRLGEVLEVVEGGAGAVTPIFEKRMSMAMDAQSATPVSPGQVAVDAQVTVRWRIGS